MFSSVRAVKVSVTGLKPVHKMLITETNLKCFDVNIIKKLQYKMHR
jgi:hypothetical protein